MQVDNGRLNFKAANVSCASRLDGDLRETAKKECNVTTSNATAVLNFAITRTAVTDTDVVVSVGVTSLYVWPQGLRPTVQQNCTIPGVPEDILGHVDSMSDAVVAALGVAFAVATVLLIAFISLSLRRKMRKKYWAVM